MSLPRSILPRPSTGLGALSRIPPRPAQLRRFTDAYGSIRVQVEHGAGERHGRRRAGVPRRVRAGQRVAVSARAPRGGSPRGKRYAGANGHLPGQNDTRLVTVLIAIPGTATGLALSYLWGPRKAPTSPSTPRASSTASQPNSTANRDRPWAGTPELRGWSICCVARLKPPRVYPQQARSRAAGRDRSRFSRSPLEREGLTEPRRWTASLRRGGLHDANGCHAVGVFAAAAGERGGDRAAALVGCRHAGATRVRAPRRRRTPWRAAGSREGRYPMPPPTTRSAALREPPGQPGKRRRGTTCCP
jgi:hypothetical protein